ncbi:MAG: urease accessory protein UreE [Planctomycetota bacterium]|jgi:urease accessory protein|nr:urease accessory protein UreE [Planctomycetota bacterium]
MPDFTENLGPVSPPAGSASLTLNYDERSRRRFPAVLDDGSRAGVALPHAFRPLAEGDVLRSAAGDTAIIHCRPEEVRVAHAKDWPSLARAAYHFGNRHATIQLTGLSLRFQPDPVLEKMAAGLGLEVEAEIIVFEPEPGIGGGHAHVRPHSGSPGSGDAPEGGRR